MQFITNLPDQSNMVHKAASFSISINVIIALFYNNVQCSSLSTPSCINTAPGVGKATARCLLHNCTSNCVCSSSMEFDICSQSCNSSMVCPSISCNTVLSCDQRTLPASNVPYIFCNSTEKCQQRVSLALSKKMIALSNFTSQVQIIFLSHS